MRRRLTPRWGGPTETAVRCKACGYWNQLTLVDGEFYCRDVARCTRLARAPEHVKEKLLETLAGLAAS